MGDLRSASATLTGLDLKKSPTHLRLNREVKVDLPPTGSLKDAIAITSEKASCELLPQTPFSLLKFQEIRFEKNVAITSQQGLTAKGGLALYKNKRITLYPELPYSQCQLIHEQFTLDAETIELQFTGEKPQLFQIATSGDSEIAFPPAGRLLCRGAILYDPETNTLFASPKTSLQFTDDTLYLEADRAHIHYPDQHLTLEGNIRLISSRFQGKETYAIAEKATYAPKEKLLILNSSSERKVLFWQDGFKLTAPEVQIRPDRETVKGIGDIHFAFDLEEQNYFEQIFSKYL